MFYTIQGEGPFAGDPALFVRLAGCNLQCPMCDTEYTQGAERHSINDLMRMTIAHLTRAGVYDQGRPREPLVVITGGEPFRQNISEYVRRLLQGGCRVQIETNGTLYIDEFPWGHPRLTTVCSPKAGKVNPHLQPHINAYKYVVSSLNTDPEDGLPTSALGLPGKPARPHNDRVLVYVNPLDSQDPESNRRNLETTAQVAIRYGYRMGVQLHKQIGYE